jgi:hypothetical protein
MRLSEFEIKSIVESFNNHFKTGDISSVDLSMIHRLSNCSTMS